MSAWPFAPIDPTRLIVHVGYSLMLCALVARDVLWLRALLVGAQSLIATYAWRIGVPSIAAWNVLFVVINTLWVIRILRERRRVVLPRELRGLYQRHFAALTPPEFLRLWNQGRRHTVQDARFATAGGYPDALFFLVHGTARVSKDGAHITDLSPGYFIAEMSLLTGDPANADVDAVGAVDVVSWPIADLRAIRQANPVLWTKIQSVLGHDIVAKGRSWDPAKRSFRSFSSWACRIPSAPTFLTQSSGLTHGRCFNSSK